jgi:GTP-binding protein
MVASSQQESQITNRKSLAYTSKTPGKTQTFNFFAVNDKPEREREVRYGDVVPGAKDPDSFYLVDVPGFGFAKVPENKRQEWSLFLNEYISTRKTLRVVFHLIDSRHGPTTEDSRIMNEFSQILPQKVTYVVVLTKADKNVKGVTKKNEGKVSRDVMESLRKTMKKNTLGKVPVILTSAETKLGRDDLWRYLKLAAEV